MVQRTVGRGVGVLVAALLAAGAAQAQGAGGSTVVLRDGRSFEAAAVEFRDRTFLVRTGDGKELRLDERDVLRVELGDPAPAAEAPRLDPRGAQLYHEGSGALRVAWRAAEQAHDVVFEVSRRLPPSEEWTPLEGVAQVDQVWSAVDPAPPAWPRRAEYRIRTLLRKRPAGSGWEERGQLVVPYLAGRTLAILPVGLRGDEAVLEVRDTNVRRLVTARAGEPVPLGDLPVKARLAAAAVEDDGVLVARVAYEGLDEPEVVRADAPPDAEGCRVVVLQPAPERSPRTARAPLDLDQAQPVDVLRAMVKAGASDVAFYGGAQDEPLDLHLRAIEPARLLDVAGQLFGRRGRPRCGVTLLPDGREPPVALAPPEGPLARLDAERISLAVDARAFDLVAALGVLRLAAGVDAVLTPGARDAIRERRAAFIHARSITLAQALTLLTDVDLLTWTTRGEVVVVKSLEELLADEIWLDLDVPDGTPFSALEPRLEAAGVRLEPPGALGLWALPAIKGRVSLAWLLQQVRGWFTQDRWGRKVALGGPRPPATSLSLRDGVFFLGPPDTSARNVGDLAGALEACKGLEPPTVHLWCPAGDAQRLLEALRGASVTVLTVNGRAPAAPAPAAPPREKRPFEPRTLGDWQTVKAGRPPGTDAELAAALGQARQAAEERPDDPDLQVALGRASLKLLYTEGAHLEISRGVFEKVVAKHPRHVEALFHLSLCQAFGGSGERLAAKQGFDRLLLLSEDHVDALLSRAQLQLYDGEPWNAKAGAQAALRRAPGRADAWFLLFQAYSGIGESVKALDALRQAVKLGPDHPDAGRWRDLLTPVEEGVGKKSGPTLDDLESRYVLVTATVNPQGPALSSIVVQPRAGGEPLTLSAGDAVDGHAVRSVTFEGEGEEARVLVTFGQGEQERTIVFTRRKG